MKGFFNRNLIYASITLFFICIFLIGLLINSLPKESNRLTSDLKNYSTNKYKIELTTNQETIAKQEEIVFDLRILPPELGTSFITEQAIDAEKYVAYNYNILKSESYKIIDEQNEQLCTNLIKDEINRKSFKIEPLIKQGTINLIAHVKFYKTANCSNTDTSNTTDIVVKKTIKVNISYKQQFFDLVNNCIKTIANHFVVFWGSFVILMFSFVLSFIRKKLKISTEIL